MWCKTCPNFAALPAGGECRSGLPVLMWSALAPAADQRTGWPSVKEADWCAQHPERQIEWQVFCQRVAQQKAAQLEAERFSASGGKMA